MIEWLGVMAEALQEAARIYREWEKDIKDIT